MNLKLFNNQYIFDFKFYIPTRQDTLMNKVQKYMDKYGLGGNRDLILTIIKHMSNKDYAIFSNPNDEQEYIQCTVDENGIVIDFPFSVIDKRSKLLHRLDYIILKNDLRKTQSIFGNSYIYEMTKNDYGSAIDIYCRQNLVFAAKIMHEILTEVYSLDPEFKMDIKIDTWKKFWF